VDTDDQKDSIREFMPKKRGVKSHACVPLSANGMECENILIFYNIEIVCGNIHGILLYSIWIVMDLKEFEESLMPSRKNLAIFMAIEMGYGNIK